MDCVGIYTYSHVGSICCSFRRKGQCEGLRIVEQATDLLHVSFLYAPFQINHVPFEEQGKAVILISNIMSEKMKKNEELQSRRDFFKKAAKGALPILGAIVLTSNPLVVRAATTEKQEPAPMGCNRSSPCTGSCYQGCSRSCTRTCVGNCTGRCTNTCKGSCSGGCTMQCENNCSGVCGGNCYGNCYGDCKTSCLHLCYGSCMDGCKHSMN